MITLTVPVKPRRFFKNTGPQLATREYQNHQAIYSQGDVADAMFHIQNGNVKLLVVSPRGKRAVTAILGPGDMFGEGCLIHGALRMSTATAVQLSTIACVKKKDLLQRIQHDPVFARHLISNLLSRMARVEEDFVDLLFNFSEKRLARILLLLTNLEEGSRADALLPQIKQESLAQMVGTTRSRVSHFMNKFRSLGFIDYRGNSDLTVHPGLWKVVTQN